MIIKIHAIVSKADTNGVNLFIAEVAEISNKYVYEHLKGWTKCKTRMTKNKSVARSWTPGSMVIHLLQFIFFFFFARGNLLRAIRNVLSKKRFMKYVFYFLFQDWF